MQILQRGQKRRLSIQDGNALAMLTWTLAMQVQNHAALFHGFEDGVKWLVGDDTRGGVGGYACRVGLDTNDALGFGAFDDGGCDFLVQV